MLAFSDLVKPETRDVVVDEVLSILETLGLSVSAWQPGQPLRTLIVSIGQAFANRSARDVVITQGGFLDTAQGGWLDLKCQSDFNEERIAAEHATGAITLTNASTESYPVDAGDLVVAHSVTGKTYRNDADIVIPPSGSLADVAITADEEGAASNAAPGMIGELVTKLNGVTVTNPIAVLGADEETDAAYVVRCREKLSALSPMGPKEVFAFVIKTPKYAPTSTPITRTKVVSDITTGEITIYAATADGAPSVGDVAIAQDAVDKWAEALCDEATVVAATAHLVDVTYDVWIETSLTEAEVKSRIASALAVYFSTAPIGGDEIPPDTGSIYVETVRQAIGTALAGVKRVDMTLPAADVPFADSEVPELGTVIGTVHFL